MVTGAVQCCDYSFNFLKLFPEGKNGRIRKQILSLSDGGRSLLGSEAQNSLKRAGLRFIPTLGRSPVKAAIAHKFTFRCPSSCLEASSLQNAETAEIGIAVLVSFWNCQ